MFELKRTEEKIALDRSGIDAISDKIVKKLEINYICSQKTKKYHSVRCEDEDGRPASGNGRHRALDLKTRRAAPVNSSPAVGHPADAGPCPAQGSRTPPHKAPSIPVNVLPPSSSPQQRGDLPFFRRFCGRWAAFCGDLPSRARFSGRWAALAVLTGGVRPGRGRRRRGAFRRCCRRPSWRRCSACGC